MEFKTPPQRMNSMPAPKKQELTNSKFLESETSKTINVKIKLNSKEVPEKLNSEKIERAKSPRQKELLNASFELKTHASNPLNKHLKYQHFKIQESSFLKMQRKSHFMPFSYQRNKGNLLLTKIDDLEKCKPLLSVESLSMRNVTSDGNLNKSNRKNVNGKSPLHNFKMSNFHDLEKVRSARKVKEIRIDEPGFDSEPNFDSYFGNNVKSVFPRTLKYQKSSLRQKNGKNDLFRKKQRNTFESQGQKETPMSMYLVNEDLSKVEKNSKPNSFFGHKRSMDNNN